MRRFFACLQFESQIENDPNDEALVDESIRLVIANDEDGALARAESLGRELEHEYLNEQGERVFWRFISVVDVQKFCEDELADGVEVYSRLNWKS